MRSLVVVVALAAPVAADPVDHARAAIYLARQGDCQTALEYARMVAQDDPELYARDLAQQTDLVRCMMQTQPLGAPALVEASPPSCSTGIYVEPSLFVGGNRGELLHRIAVGARFRNCASDGRDLTHARLGATLAIAGDSFLDHNIALGIEAELDHPIADQVRVGGRVGYESNGSSLFTFGGRLHYASSVFLGIDGFYASNDFSYYPQPYGYGVLVGAGFEGKPGIVVGAGELIVTGLLFVLVVAECSQHSCFGG